MSTTFFLEKATNAHSPENAISESNKHVIKLIGFQDSAI